jgi:hypothetical protein
MAFDRRKALEIARDAYQASTNYFDSNIRNQIEADIRQWQGQHPSGSKYNSESYRGRSRLFRPKTRSMVMRNEAIAAEALFSSLDVVSIAARDDRNDVTRASGQLMQALLQYRLTTPDSGIPWFLVAMGAYQDAQVSGVVASYHYWRYNQVRKLDRPWIELVPVENIRFDPAASWLDTVNSSPYVIRMVPMYVKDVLDRMTKPDPLTGAPRWNPLSPTELAAMTKQQWDSTRLTRQGQRRTDNMDHAGAITEYSIVWCHQNVVEWNGRDYVYWTAGTEAVLRDPVPLEVEFAHGKRPFVLGYSAIETHKQYPGGPVRNSADVQAEINEIANSRIDNVKFVLAKRYFVKRGKQVDLQSLRRNMPGSATLMTDPANDVVVHDFADVTGSSYQEQDRLNLDFDDVSGTFSGSSVASNRRLNETVGGMNILTTNSNQLGAYRLRTFVETWVEPALRQTMLLEQAYESDMTMLALAAGKAKLWQQFGIDQVTDELLMQDLTLTCNVGMGATNPQDRINNLATALRSLVEILSAPVLTRAGLNGPELIKEVMGAVGYKDGGRFFDLESDDPRIDSLIGIIDDLTQQLNAKNPPELIKAQVEESAAKVKNLLANSVKVGVEAAYSAMQAAEVVASAPMVAPIADKVMQAVGFQPPNPVGQDPNLVPGAPEPPMFGGMVNDQTMTAHGAQADPMGASPDPRTNTSPMQPPVPASPLGARAGIETSGFDGGEGHAQQPKTTLPALQSKPDALNFQPRWFKQWDGQQQEARANESSRRAGEESKKAAEDADRKRKEDEARKFDEATRKAAADARTAYEKAMKQFADQVSREIERAIKPIEKELEVLRNALDREPTEREETPPPVINVEPHIYIDKGGGTKVMEITAPSGQKYKGSIQEEK